MVLTGKYQHVKNENLKEFIMAFGGELTDFATKSDSMTCTMEVTCDGDNFTMSTVYPDNTINLKFTLGAEFDDPMPNGQMYKSVASSAGPVLTIKTHKDGAEVGFRTYEFSETECFMTMGAKSTPIVAKRWFKRI
ncbi:PREDICTED: fatty acid-binding protein-like [Nicrophorus vespilloides]|uniref:Fatty acid-binding protein-like n=1 Tax=Nicrophorus vespilloides TaxID=110193 RepID=A0ABM1MYU2_NICVS|nr:PREDICTED: fatty acid-binding protein-like [Nicrophorus vespilloides]XP_017779743.1 PREDICTED: fatty acid-binding protein-like [Nicrophorus vespilloides]